MIGNLCTCGNIKSRNAKCCKECWDRYRTLMADATCWDKKDKRDYEKDTCPECGGVKYKRAKRCHLCHDQSKQMRELQKKQVDTCPRCGGNKSKKKQVCSKCYRMPNPYPSSLKKEW